MPDKEYFITYYNDHKEEYLKRNRRWRKNNPKKVSKNNKKYYKEFSKKRKKAINKSNYAGEPLKKLLIERYGKYLLKTKDNITLTQHRKKMFCVDCIYYQKGKISKGCPGWDKCPFKEEILEEINNEK